MAEAIYVRNSICVSWGFCTYEFKGYWKGAGVSIRQESVYPMVLAAEFHIKTSEPVVFAMHFRFPAWAKRMYVNGVGYDHPEGGCHEITLERSWHEDRVDIRF